MGGLMETQVPSTTRRATPTSRGAIHRPCCSATGARHAGRATTRARARRRGGHLGNEVVVERFDVQRVDRVRDQRLLDQPIDILVQGERRREIDLQQPRLQVLVDQEVEPVQLERCDVQEGRIHMFRRAFACPTSTHPCPFTQVTSWWCPVGGIPDRRAGSGRLPHALTMGIVAGTLGTTPSTLGSNASTLRNTPATLGATPSTLGTTPSTLGTTPSTLGTTPSTLGGGEQQPTPVKA